MEILGRIGQDARVSAVGANQVARFSVATSETFKDRSGSIHEETTWHNVAVWQGKQMTDFSALKKGTAVHIIGRIRNSRYKAATGEDKYYTEIVASELEIRSPQGAVPTVPVEIQNACCGEE